MGKCKLVCAQILILFSSILSRVVVKMKQLVNIVCRFFFFFAAAIAFKKNHKGKAKVYSFGPSEDNEEDKKFNKWRVSVCTITPRE